MKNAVLILFIFSLLWSPCVSLAAFEINDPYTSSLWYLDAIKAPNAWEESLGEGVIVAVLDSGFDISHPDLINNIYINQREVYGDGKDNDRNGYVDDFRGWDFVNNDEEVKFDVTAQCLTPAGDCQIDAVHHGTMIAGIVGAAQNNYLGITGIAPQAKILPLKVLDKDGTGRSEDVILAIEYAIANGAKVINMSFVGREDDPFLSAAIENAYNRGIAVVLAGGNAEDGITPVNLTDSPRYPVCSDEVNDKQFALGVGAVNANNLLSFFSNYGDCIDVVAPGQGIFGAQLRDEAAQLTTEYAGGYLGTSLAAPMVSGALAVLTSRYPQLSVAQKYRIVRESATNIDDKNQGKIGMYGGGVLNMERMLAFAAHVSDEVSYELGAGRLIKSTETSAVYYLSPDDKRYVFPDAGTYASWFGKDFSAVETIEPIVMARYPLAGSVTYRPGKRLIKIRSVPQVYAVDSHGVLRWVSTEAVAKELYGTEWAKLVSDVDDSFFINYAQGDAIMHAPDFNASKALVESQISK
ncbi:S8 family serine peptidase [Candidatus Falkowbacteria bacterium]|nr:S8 family serine peptidase [Candidatus Falkowbacteria bacterium]